MAEPAFRSLLLERLRERDRFAGQFTRIVLSYSSITESLNLLNLNKRQRHNSGGSDNHRDVAELREKLAEVIAKKSENDQQLIDATKKIVDLEARLAAVTETKGELEHQLREVREQLRQREAELHELQHTRQEIADEVLALNALNRQLELKFTQADQERVELLDRYKQVKEEQVKIINDYNEKEHQLHLEKKRLEISEAIRSQAPAAAAASTSADEGRDRRASESGSVGSFMSGGGLEDVPSRCFFKAECDDNGEVNDCTFSRTGKFFFTGGSDKTVRMYQLDGDRASFRGKLIGFAGGINRLDVHRDLPLLLGASNDKTIRLYNIDDQRVRGVLTGHSDKVSSARFLSITNRVMSGSLDRTIKVWDYNSIRCVKTYFPGSTVTDVATSDVTQMLISSHFDKSIRFWDQRADTPAGTQKFEGKLTSLCISTDGNKLLAACRDESLYLLDLRMRTVEHIYTADSFRASFDYSKCTISPGMNYVAAGAADGQIFVWNLHSTRLEKVLQRAGHENNAVYSVAFHPSNRILLSTDRRRTFCLWD